MNTNLKPDEVLEKVSKAVRALGETGDIVMHDFVSGDTGRIKVYISGKYFGVFDTARETFVD